MKTMTKTRSALAASPDVVPASILTTRARLQRLAVIGFPLLLVVSAVAVGGGTAGSDSSTYLANIADHRTGVLVGSILAMACALLFAAVAQVVSERLAPSMPRLAWYGKLVAWVGMFAGYAINSYGIVDWAATDSSLDRREMVEFFDILQSVALPAVYQPGILAPLSVLVLGIGLWRSHSVPTSTAAVLVLAAITFPLGQIGEIVPVQVICAALFLGVGVRLTTSVPAPKTIVN